LIGVGLAATFLGATAFLATGFLGAGLALATGFLDAGLAFTAFLAFAAGLAAFLAGFFDALAISLSVLGF
jgi:hypothetical protein